MVSLTLEPRNREQRLLPTQTLGTVYLSLFLEPNPNPNLTALASDTDSTASTALTLFSLLLSNMKTSSNPNLTLNLIEP